MELLYHHCLLFQQYYWLNLNHHLTRHHVDRQRFRNVFPALNSKIDELWLVDTEVVDKQSQQKGELKIYVGRINNPWFYFEMLSPLKDKDFYHW